MANQKLTDLTSASTPLSGSEQVYVVQSGNSRKATAQQLADVPGEWSGETVSQAEAEAGTATTRRAWTAQRVFQAAAAWWAASAAKTKLDGIAAGAEVNVNADWNASSGDAQILNKPTLGTAAALDVASTGDATSGQVVKGNDSRLSDSRTPTAHTQAASTISDSSAAGRALLTAADAAAQRSSLGLGTAATANTGTSAGNVVALDGSGKLPAVDGSALTGLPPGITDLGYTASSRLLTSSTGADVTLPLFDTASSNAGLVPGSSTGGTTNFLRADGTWAAPPSSPPGGSTTQIQFNDGGSFGGDADLTYNKTTNLLTTKGDINLDDGGSFTTTLQTITATANRVLSLPDATGTVALVAGSSGQLIWNSSGAYAGASTLTYDGSILTTSGRFINSYNSSLATPGPAKAWTGTWFTSGGTATTTKPHVLVEPTGTTSTAWATSGTGIGVNAASGFAGNLLDLQLNGSSRLAINSAGAVTFGVGGAIFEPFSSGLFLNYTSTKVAAFGAGEFTLNANTVFAFNSANPFQGTRDLELRRDAADTLAQRRSTNAQTFRVYNTYTSATNYELGKLEWSSNVFRIGTEKGSGGGTARAVEVHTDSVSRLALDTTGSVRVVTGLTVATLPGTPAVGMIARVTDATAPVVGSAVTGGGSAAALVWYNGTAWNVIGV